MFDLTEYMNNGIEQIVKQAMKSTLKNPLESAFMFKYMISQRAAAEKRKTSEANGMHIPPFLIASITTHCNLYCKGCYARANKSCGEHIGWNELTDDEWKRIFEEASKLGISFILLAGGEPLIRKNVLNAASCFPEIIFPVFTNGTMLDKSYIDFLNKNRNLIPILSLEGDCEQTDSRRGKGVYDLLTDTMKKMNERGIFYGTSITVTTKNYEYVTGEKFISMLNESGCKLAIFVEYVPVQDSTKDLAFTDNEREILESRLKILRSEYDNMIFLSFPGDEKYMGGCLAAGRGFFHINALGSAEPCPFSPYSDVNIKNGSLKEAISSPLFKRLTTDEFINKEHRGGCALFERRDEVQDMIKSANSR